MPCRNFCAVLSPIPYNFCNAHLQTGAPENVLDLMPELLPCARGLYLLLFFFAGSGTAARSSEAESEKISSSSEPRAGARPPSESESSWHSLNPSPSEASKKQAVDVESSAGSSAAMWKGSSGMSKMEQICNSLYAGSSDAKWSLDFWISLSRPANCRKQSADVHLQARRVRPPSAVHFRFASG